MIGPHNFKPLTTDPGSLMHMQSQLLCSQCGLIIHIGYSAKEPCPHAPTPQTLSTPPPPVPTRCQTCKHWDFFVKGYNGKECVRPGGLQQGYTCFEAKEVEEPTKEPTRRNCISGPGLAAARQANAEPDNDLAQDLIFRYQQCVLRILKLFDGDPLPEDCHAHTFIERLEALLDRDLLGPRGGKLPPLSGGVP